MYVLPQRLQDLIEANWFIIYHIIYISKYVFYHMRKILMKKLNNIKKNKLR